MSIAQTANSTNNAEWQELREARWAPVRESVWELLDPLLAEGARVLLVGAGNCDDLPIRRIAARAAHIDMVDFDEASAQRGVAKLPEDSSARVTVIHEDVTGGCADTVLTAIRDKAELPMELNLPLRPFAEGGYDLVVGDMLYTQLLHPGLIALEVFGDRQLEIMHRYDPALTSALVTRLHASAAPHGNVVHIHDVACWAKSQQQPLTLDEVLESPFWTWTSLSRHDACDPYLTLGNLGGDIRDSRWWRWPFEPEKEFLVRATVAGQALAHPL